VKIDDLVPMAFVKSVPASIAFYEKLGFKVRNTVEHAGRVSWAWLESGEANLMVSHASDPVDPKVQAVLFYLYTADVAAFQAETRAKGVKVGEINRPFYMPEGEVRVEDPDGYVLLVGQRG
jgi:catechol 2,3-dioxygenase-like lactoylglutathione lyase family enzyme